jgi:serine/threonine protein kinase
VFSVFESVSGFCLELELMESFDLFDKLSKDGIMIEANVKQVVSQLIDAVSLCNKLGIAHRDIKLSNITFPLTRKETQTDDSLFHNKMINDISLNNNDNCYHYNSFH